MAWNYPSVPFQNNLAERRLRRIVMHRKSMECYRTEVSKNWFNVGLSVMQTWRLQEKNVNRTLEVNENLNIDLDERGNLIGIEILNAKTVMPKTSISKKLAS